MSGLLMDGSFVVASDFAAYGLRCTQRELRQEGLAIPVDFWTDPVPCTDAARHGAGSRTELPARARVEFAKAHEGEADTGESAVAEAMTVPSGEKAKVVEPP
jgi:hypothetical protein